MPLPTWTEWKERKKNQKTKTSAPQQSQESMEESQNQEDSQNSNKTLVEEINHVTKEQLLQTKGIGPKTAEKILECLPISSVDDLNNQLQPATVKKLFSYFTTKGSSAIITPEISKKSLTETKGESCGSSTENTGQRPVQNDNAAGSAGTIPKSQG